MKHNCDAHQDTALLPAHKTPAQDPPAAVPSRPHIPLSAATTPAVCGHPAVSAAQDPRAVSAATTPRSTRPPAVCGHHTAQHKTPAVCGHHTAQHKTPRCLRPPTPRSTSPRCLAATTPAQHKTPAVCGTTSSSAHRPPAVCGHHRSTRPPHHRSRPPLSAATIPRTPRCLRPPYRAAQDPPLSAATTPRSTRPPLSAATTPRSTRPPAVCGHHTAQHKTPAVCGHHTAQHKTPAVCGHHTAQHKTPVTEPTGSVNRDVIEASKRDVHKCKFFIIFIYPPGATTARTSFTSENFGSGCSSLSLRSLPIKNQLTLHAPNKKRAQWLALLFGAPFPSYGAIQNAYAQQTAMCAKTCWGSNHLFLCWTASSSLQSASTALPQFVSISHPKSISETRGEMTAVPHQHDSNGVNGWGLSLDLDSVISLLLAEDDSPVGVGALDSDSNYLAEDVSASFPTRDSALPFEEELVCIGDDEVDPCQLLGLDALFANLLVPPSPPRREEQQPQLTPARLTARRESTSSKDRVERLATMRKRVNHNRSRRLAKEELQHLRVVVKELDKQLTVLLQAESRQVEANHKGEKLGVESIQKILYWKQRALHEKANLEKAVAEKLALETQIECQQLLKNNLESVLAGLDDILILAVVFLPPFLFVLMQTSADLVCNAAMGAHCGHPPSFALSNTLATNLDAFYERVGSVWRDCGFSSSIREAQEHRFRSDTSGVYLEFIQSRTTPFTISAVDRAFLECVTRRLTSPPTGELKHGNQRHQFNTYAIQKRFADTHHVVTVWDLWMEIDNDPTTQVRETGWRVLRAVPDRKDTKQNLATGACILQTCTHITTPGTSNPLRESLVAGTLAHSAIRLHREKMDLVQQKAENLLVDSLLRQNVRRTTNSKWHDLAQRSTYFTAIPTSVQDTETAQSFSHLSRAVQDASPLLQTRVPQKGTPPTSNGKKRAKRYATRGVGFTQHEVDALSQLLNEHILLAKDE
ncbi:hypothetical protein FI667_g3374, partial [Globisporangium splendens]